MLVRYSFIGAFLILACRSSVAQQRFTFNQSQVCSYYGESITDSVYTFESDSEAERLIDDIMRHAGLPANFKVKSANVPNAAAVIQEGQRVILYSQSFVRDLRRATGTEWAATSMLAHEIGHHLSGHTLLQGGSRPELELEADKFSGHILARMGASLRQARAAIETFAGPATTTHPPKSARLAAIENGWTSATNQTTTKLPPTPPPIDRPEPKPQPKPQPATTALQLSGRWSTSVNSSLAFSQTSATTYNVVESNVLGPIAEGNAVVEGNTFALRIVYPYLGIVNCVGTRSGVSLQAQCNDILGLPFQLLMQRID